MIVILSKHVLEMAYEPGLTEDVFPSCVALKSTQNITIEAWWTQLGLSATKNFKKFVEDGRLQYIYNPGNPLHM
jgi:hypothetical protein